MISFYSYDNLLISISSHHATSLRLFENKTKVQFWSGNLDLDEQSKKHMKSLYSELQELNEEVIKTSNKENKK